MTMSGRIAMIDDLLDRLRAARAAGDGGLVAEIEAGLLGEFDHLREIGALAHIRELLAQEEAVLRFQLMTGRAVL